MSDRLDPGHRPDALARAARDELSVRDFVRKLVYELAPGGNGSRIDEPRLVEDLAYHSLALMELAFALEDEFDLQAIDERTARRIVTLADVANHVVGELRATGRLETPKE